MNTDKLRIILIGVYLTLKERYDKLGGIIEKVEPTPEYAGKAVDLVLRCVTAIQEVNQHRDDLIVHLKEVAVDNKVRFQPDSQQALALIMGLREVNITITKLTELLPLAHKDTIWLRMTGDIVDHGIQEYVDGLK